MPKIKTVLTSISIHSIIALIIILVAISVFKDIFFGLFALALNPLEHPVEFLLGILVLGIGLLAPATFIAGLLLTYKYTFKRIKDIRAVKVLYALISSLSYIILVGFVLSLVIPRLPNIPLSFTL